MSDMSCPSPELLFEGLLSGDGAIEQHLGSCAGCAALVESHRQLEKDLYRIQDPLPPPDFLVGVMARVAEAPVPVRRELRSFGAIVGVCSALLALVIATGALGGFATPATAVVSSLTTAQSIAQVLGHTLRLLWSAAALPLTAGLGSLLLASLLGLWRLSGNRTSEVTA